jgi:hypothetical protein
MRYLILSLLIYSCTAQWHYNKAIKKGLEITTKSDTIRITTIDSIPVIQHDTIVYQKFFTSKDTIIYYKDVYIPKTIREIRIENKLIRDTIRIKENAQIKLAKEETKQTKAENNWYQKFLLGLVLGVIISTLIGYAIRMKR